MATAIKLDKAQRAELEKFRKSLRESEDAVTDAVAEYERRCESVREKLIPVLEKHNELLAEVKVLVEEIDSSADALDELQEEPDEE